MTSFFPTEIKLTTKLEETKEWVTGGYKKKKQKAQLCYESPYVQHLTCFYFVFPFKTICIFFKVCCYYKIFMQIRTPTAQLLGE